MYRVHVQVPDVVCKPCSTGAVVRIESCLHCYKKGRIKCITLRRHSPQLIRDQNKERNEECKMRPACISFQPQPSISTSTSTPAHPRTSADWYSSVQSSPVPPMQIMKKDFADRRELQKKEKKKNRKTAL